MGNLAVKLLMDFKLTELGSTDDLADLFHQYKFLVGVSMDGPPEIHNVYRKNVKGKPTHQMVMNGIKSLQKHLS